MSKGYIAAATTPNREVAIVFAKMEKSPLGTQMEAFFPIIFDPETAHDFIEECRKQSPQSTWVLYEMDLVEVELVPENEGKIHSINLGLDADPQETDL